MKLHPSLPACAAAVLGLCLLFAPAPAAPNPEGDVKGDQAAETTGENEYSRVMQEYIARRQEWFDIRRAALDKIKRAADDREKKLYRDKLAEDERPYVVRMDAAATALEALQKARRAEIARSRPAGAGTLQPAK
jgi:hypothetical protein